MDTENMSAPDSHGGSDTKPMEIVKNGTKP